MIIVRHILLLMSTGTHYVYPHLHGNSAVFGYNWVYFRPVNVQI